MNLVLDSEIIVEAFIKRAKPARQFVRDLPKLEHILCIDFNPSVMLHDYNGQFRGCKGNERKEYQQWYREMGKKGKFNANHFCGHNYDFNSHKSDLKTLHLSHRYDFTLLEVSYQAKGLLILSDDKTKKYFGYTRPLDNAVINYACNEMKITVESLQTAINSVQKMQEASGQSTGQNQGGVTIIAENVNIGGDVVGNNKQIGGNAINATLTKRTETDLSESLP